MRFYVTVRDAGKVGVLLGPYKTKSAAEAQVDRGRRLAIAADPFAFFYAYGVTGVPGDKVARTVFDKDAEPEGAEPLVEAYTHEERAAA
jgi:hypothetical protein